MSRIMSIDFGTKAVGVAISDELQMTVRPLTTIRRKNASLSQLAVEIKKLADENEIKTIVVGFPLNMDGTRGSAADRVERFIACLEKVVTVPVRKVDERLTSHEADMILREMGVDRHERGLKSDEYAAAIILQDYIDALSRAHSTKQP